jgi:hypothetical protein
VIIGRRFVSEPGAVATGSCTQLEAQHARLCRALPQKAILSLLEANTALGTEPLALHYVSHPVFPLRNHVAMINLEKVGRAPEKPISVTGAASSSSINTPLLRSGKIGAGDGDRTRNIQLGNQNHRSLVSQLTKYCGNATQELQIGHTIHHT